MVQDSRKTVVTGRIPPPQDFRAQATGVGKTILASRFSGANRAQRVADSCDPQCAKMLPDSYPRPTPDGLTFAPPDMNGANDRQTGRIYDLPTKTRPARAG